MTGWRGGWLGRILNIHSPHGHLTGGCWCGTRPPRTAPPISRPVSRGPR